MIALDQAIGVVVNGFAGPRKQFPRPILFAEDQGRIVLGALHGDSHGELAEGAAGERIGAAKRL